MPDQNQTPDARVVPPAVLDATVDALWPRWRIDAPNGLPDAWRDRAADVARAVLAAAASSSLPDSGERDVLTEVVGAARAVEALLDRDAPGADWTLDGAPLDPGDGADALLELRHRLADLDRAHSSSSPPAGAEREALTAFAQVVSNAIDAKDARDLAILAKVADAIESGYYVEAAFRSGSMHADGGGRLHGALVELDRPAPSSPPAGGIEAPFEKPQPAGGEGDDERLWTAEVAASRHPQVLDPASIEDARRNGWTVREWVPAPPVSSVGEGRDGYVPLSIREAGGEALEAWKAGASYDEARALIPREVRDAPARERCDEFDIADPDVPFDPDDHLTGREWDGAFGDRPACEDGRCSGTRVIAGPEFSAGIMPCPACAPRDLSRNDTWFPAGTRLRARHDGSPWVDVERENVSRYLSAGFEVQRWDGAFWVGVPARENGGDEG